MPRYGYGQYGTDPSGMMQGAGGNPFYNPYSKYPNFGGGISAILQQIMAMKQMKEQQKREEEEKEWRRGMEEYNWYLKGTEEERAREKHEKEMKAPPKPSAKQEEIDIRDRFAYQKVAAGEWTTDEGIQYKYTGEKPLRVRTTEVKALAEAGRAPKEPALTPFQAETIKNREREQTIDAINELIDDIDTRNKQDADEALQALLNNQPYIPPDKAFRAKQKARLSKLRIKARSKSGLSAKDQEELSAIASEGLDKKTSPSLFGIPLDTIGRTLGGFMGGQTQGATTAPTIPPEVREYVSKHPDISVEQAMQLYLKWKQQK